ncbi:MAG: type II toxin-antitoxin system MqsR family toxin, partial [Burkholderiaceae bacterium]
MEKNKPHYPLQDAQAIVARDGVLAFTQTAIMGAAVLGLSGKQACQMVCQLTRSGFYKSMTTYADSRVWQDVYHAQCPDGRVAYVKLTLTQGGKVVIQFKEQ